MKPRLFKFRLLTISYVLFIFCICTAFVFGDEKTTHKISSVHEVTKPFVKQATSVAALDAFDFNDGTCQEWTVDGPRDEDGDGPFSSHFSHSWADPVSYPTLGLADPIGNNNGSYKICNVMGHGITNPGATYWYMYWISPDLSTNSVWQNASGYAVNILNYMELTGAAPGVHLEVWVILFVTVYDHDQSRNRYFSAFTSYQQIQNWAQNPAWIEKSFNFSSVFSTVPNHTVKEIYIGVRGKMANYFEGGIYIDEAVPLGGSGSPEISLNLDNIDFGMFDNSMNFDISNTGEGTLSWTVTEQPEEPWITSISPSSGAGDATVAVTVDRNQLSENSETGTLLVASNGGNEELTITVARDTISQWFRTDIETKLLADDGQEGDSFGYAAAISGDYAVVGAYNNDNDNGIDAGAVYIFKRNGNSWNQQQKLIAPDGAAEDLFGYSVDISGDYILVTSAWDDDAGAKSGSAYIYKHDGTVWNMQQKISASDAGEDNRFGINAAISGEFVIVGAFFDNDFGYRSGSAYIYERTGTTWVEREILYASDADTNDWFGVSVSIDGDYAAVGSRFDTNENGKTAGGVYIFQRQGVDWIQQQKVIASDGSAADHFHKNAIHGDYLVVGAYDDDDNGMDSGSIYVFKRDGTNWVEQERHTASDASIYDKFGADVAIYENRIVAGASWNRDHGGKSGSIYIFTNNGTSWSETEKIIASDGDAGDIFGNPVDIDKNYTIVGARNDDDKGENAGAAYIYCLPFIQGAPVLSVSPTTIDFGTTDTNHSIQITNTGSSVLTWDIAVQGSSPWIKSITPSSGTGNSYVIITVDRTLLKSISDVGTLTVSSNGGSQDVTLLIAKEAGTLPDSWNFSTNTGNSATIVLPTTANPNIDGVELQNGDYIGVFTPAGLCCGWKQWQGTNISLPTWGDNDQTSEIDGFQSGELIYYRVYRLSEAKEWDVVETAYSQGNGNYSPNAFIVLSKFDVTSQRCLMINFAAGWNMFSTNVAPDDPNIATVMSPVVGQVIIVKNGNGQTYIPVYGINDIGSMVYDAGYQAYFTDPISLEVCGTPLNSNMPINLPLGWSLVSYLPTVPIDAAIALSTISSQLIIAKNNDGQTYIPAYGINDIGNMQSGQGYQLYLNAAGVLIYETGSLLKLQELAKPAIEHFTFVSNTGENATLVVTSDINPRYSDGSSLEIGDEIGVFTSDGLCCSAVVWTGDNKAISVWGNNSQTTEVDGFTAGDTFRVRIWNKASDTEYTATVSYQSGNPVVYQANGFSVLTQLIAELSSVDVERPETALLPTTFNLSQNYPNPFNSETFISYQISEKTTVELNIFDLQGRYIRTLVNENKEVGRYSVSWDGRDQSGNLVPSAVYLYRLKATDVLFSKKMILLK